MQHWSQVMTRHVNGERISNRSGRCLTGMKGVGKTETLPVTTLLTGLLLPCIPVYVDLECFVRLAPGTSLFQVSSHLVNIRCPKSQHDQATTLYQLWQRSRHEKKSNSFYAMDEIQEALLFGRLDVWRDIKDIGEFSFGCLTSSTNDTDIISDPTNYLRRKYDAELNDDNPDAHAQPRDKIRNKLKYLDQFFSLNSSKFSNMSIQ